MVRLRRSRGWWSMRVWLVVIKMRRERRLPHLGRHAGADAAAFWRSGCSVASSLMSCQRAEEERGWGGLRTREWRGRMRGSAVMLSRLSVPRSIACAWPC